MSTADTTTEAFADTRPSDAADLPDYAPIPKSAEPSAELKAMMASSGIRVFTPFLSL